MANPVSSAPPSGQSILTFYENREGLSSTVARKALEVAHRVPESDLKAHIFLCSQTEKPAENSLVESIVKRPLNLPTQNEKKCLSAPIGEKYQAKPELYSKEFGDFLLQSAGYEPTSFLEKSAEFLSNNECAYFLNIETTCLPDSTISVLIVKKALGYGVAYFREAQMCKAYCNAKQLLSGQVRQVMQILSLYYFGIMKSQTLEPLQKPLALSYQNPDCTSTYFMTFCGEQEIREEYILDEEKLSNKIESLKTGHGTYMHFTHDDLETIIPPKEMGSLHGALCETGIGWNEVKHLL